MINKINFEDIHYRLQKITGLKTVEEIAEKINVPYNTYKKKQKIPYDKLVIFANNENINLNWLMFGEGEVFIKNETTQKKIINGDNAMINVNSNHKIKHYGNNNINKQISKNSDDNRINEIIELYQKVPPKEQELIYHRLKFKVLEAQDN